MCVFFLLAKKWKILISRAQYISYTRSHKDEEYQFRYIKTDFKDVLVATRYFFFAALLNAFKNKPR